MITETFRPPAPHAARWIFGTRRWAWVGLAAVVVAIGFATVGPPGIVLGLGLVVVLCVVALVAFAAVATTTSVSVTSDEIVHRTLGRRRSLPRRAHRGAVRAEYDRMVRTARVRTDQLVVVGHDGTRIRLSADLWAADDLDRLTSLVGARRSRVEDAAGWERALPGSMHPAVRRPAVATAVYLVVAAAALALVAFAAAQRGA